MNKRDFWLGFGWGAFITMLLVAFFTMPRDIFAAEPMQFHAGVHGKSVRANCMGIAGVPNVSGSVRFTTPVELTVNQPLIVACSYFERNNLTGDIQQWWRRYGLLEAGSTGKWALHLAKPGKPTVSVWEVTRQDTREETQDFREQLYAAGLLSDEEYENMRILGATLTYEGYQHVQAKVKEYVEENAIDLSGIELQMEFVPEE